MQGKEIFNLTIPEVVKILKASGSKKITKNIILEDIKNGAPKNKDGTINLINYGAWLIGEMS